MRMFCGRPTALPLLLAVAACASGPAGDSARGPLAADGRDLRPVEAIAAGPDRAASLRAAGYRRLDAAAAEILLSGSTRTIVGEDGGRTLLAHRSDRILHLAEIGADGRALGWSTRIWFVVEDGTYCHAWGVSADRECGTLWEDPAVADYVLLSASGSGAQRLALERGISKGAFPARALATEERPVVVAWGDAGEAIGTAVAWRWIDAASGEERPDVAVKLPHPAGRGWCALVTDGGGAEPAKAEAFCAGGLFAAGRASFRRGAVEADLTDAAGRAVRVRMPGG